MARALGLARAQKGRTEENPSVGCVIVKDGNIIGEGATQDGGRPHAEAFALSNMTQSPEGAVAYVTLEPCSHFGKSPPCAKALIDAKIARCVIALIDPDPRVNWRGAALLQEAGIDVEIGLGAEEAREIMADFLKRFKS